MARSAKMGKALSAQYDIKPTVLENGTVNLNQSELTLLRTPDMDLDQMRSVFGHQLTEADAKIIQERSEDLAQMSVLNRSKLGGQQGVDDNLVNSAQITDEVI